MASRSGSEPPIASSALPARTGATRPNPATTAAATAAAPALTTPDACAAGSHAHRATMDAAAYVLAAAVDLAGINMTTGTAAVAYCVGCAAVFLCAAWTAAFGEAGFTPARRDGLAAALCILAGFLHNTVLALSEGFRRVPGSATTRPWTFFWSTRFGPLHVLLLNLAAGFPRGRRLLALLTVQGVVAAATTPAGCRKSLAAYEVMAPFFTRLADVWGAGWRAAARAALGDAAAVPGAPPPHPAPPACGDHACVVVTLALYALVAGLSWAVAPAPASLPGGTRRRHGRLGGWWVPVAVAGAVWTGLPRLLPRPGECVGRA